jgi:hypothetical protein
VIEGGTENFFGANWVDVPTDLQLAIQGLRPNPAVRDIVVSFTLPRAADVRLEWLDLAGRRVHVDELAGLPAGRNTLRLQDATLPSGLYFLRLTQGARSVTARAAIMR